MPYITSAVLREVAQGITDADAVRTPVTAEYVTVPRFRSGAWRPTSAIRVAYTDEMLDSLAVPAFTGMIVAYVAIEIARVVTAVVVAGEATTVLEDVYNEMSQVRTGPDTTGLLVIFPDVPPDN